MKIQVDNHTLEYVLCTDDEQTVLVTSTSLKDVEEHAHKLIGMCRSASLATERLESYAEAQLLGNGFNTSKPHLSRA